MLRKFTIAIAIAIAASLGLAAHAGEGMELSMKSRSQAASTVPAREYDAPFRVAIGDPLPDYVLRDDGVRHVSGSARNTCESTRMNLCYDMAEGRIHYRGARGYMPKVEGLSAESLSVRHNSIVLRYSFR